MYSSEHIQNLTWSILEQLNTKTAPVPIKEVALKRGLQVKPYNLGPDVSGVLYIKGETGIIGYNPSDPQVRQRFTIAHELGHYELHRTQGEVFADKQFQVHFRDHNSSSGENPQEKEANAFAAAILMPEVLLIEEIKKHCFDLADESALKAMAKLFNVSLLAMAFRIANLRLY